MDVWRSIRVRDSLWNPPLRTLRLSGDLPFLQWTLWYNTVCPLVSVMPGVG
jgi:hypothetical protein